MAKKMIIKGVGTFLAKIYNKDGKGAEVVTLGTLQDLRITFNTEIEDIFGGDGLFPIDNLVRSKTIEITATDAKFDLDILRLMMGSTVQNDVNDYIWVLNEQATVDVSGVVQLKKGTQIFSTDPAESVSVRVIETGELVPSSSITIDKVAGTITLPTTYAGKDVVINYKISQTVDKVDIMIDEVPFPVTVIHHGSFLQADGTYAGIETEIFACKAQGQFTINAARATASANEVALRVIDSGRPDGKLGTIKRFDANVKI
ncbi:MAG: hypothetical protein QXI16_02725 [Sulfolobaceae archaeon]